MMTLPLRAALLLAPLAFPATGQAAPPAESLGERAAALHRQQRWSAAYARFIAAANHGDAEAARIAVFMHRYDALLYRNHWDISPQDVADWKVGTAGPAVQPGVAAGTAGARRGQAR